MALTSSVIICTRNRPDDIVRCLASLSKQSVTPTQLIIVDSSDNKLELNSRFQEIFSSMIFVHSNLIYLHTKPGLTYQRNVGIDASSGEIVYFFDDDVILEPGYLQEMNNIFMSRPEFAGGMGDITNVSPASWKYKMFRTVFLLPREGSSGMFTYSGMPTHPYGTKEFKQVEVLGGCGMAYRAEILKKYMFDEKFHGYAYLEDCDVSRRISYEHPLFFNPKARLQHLASPLARDRIVDNSTMFIRNYSYHYFKNFHSRNQFKIVVYWWSIAGLFIEALLMRNKEKIGGYWYGLRGDQWVTR